MADVLLRIDFPSCLHDCETALTVEQWDDEVNDELYCPFIPMAWNIDRRRLTAKIKELLSDEWIARVRDAFLETLNTALQYE